MIGEKFNRLTVIAESEKIANGKNSMQSAWLCKCECGAEFIAAQYKLKSGRTKSCGCFASEAASAKRKLIPNALNHGHASHGRLSPTYITWSGMIQRCTYEGNKRWNNYGGRGIRVCEEWKKFENFLKDMGVRPTGKTLDRINVNGNYEPSNCRWATNKEQSLNKTTSKQPNERNYCGSN